MSSKFAGRRPAVRKGFGCEAVEDGSRALVKTISASKTSGALNLSNRQLQEVIVLLKSSIKAAKHHLQTAKQQH